MKFLSQRLLFIILSLAFVIAAFFVYSSFIKPEYAAVTQLRSELSFKTDSLAQYESSFLKLQDMLGGQNIQQLKESVSRILPDASNDGYVTAQLVGFAKLNNLSILSISNSAEPIASSKSKIIRSIGSHKTRITVSGTYAGVKSYVQQLENNLLFLDVLAFAVQEKKAASGGEFLEYAITVASYYQVK